MIVECPGCRNRYDVTGRPPGTRARCRCGTLFELPHPPAQAGMLDCPKCGGAVAATNHACEYCHAPLLVKACPRCFARIFHGAKHCTHCGCKVTEPAQADAEGTAEPRRCPRCQDQALVGRLVGEVLLDECAVCYGIFLDTSALERILQERRQVRAEAVLGAVPRKTVSDAPVGPVYVKCPDCANIMNRRNFAPGAGVIIDTCRAHGTWFDADELPRVIEFCMQGGLERAARREAEAAQEEARRARVAARAQGVTPSAPLPGAEGDLSRAGIFGSLLGVIAQILR